MFEMAMTANDGERRPETAPDAAAEGDSSVATPLDVLPKLRAFAARVLGVAPSHPDAEDCAQEALARSLTDSNERGAGFVFGIARNVALDHLRRRGRRRETFAGAPDSQSDLGRVASSAPSPEEQSAQAQREARLLHALEELPENQRVALRMFYLEKMPYDAIARTMGVSMGTVATWLARGKARLATQLQRSTP